MMKQLALPYDGNPTTLPITDHPDDIVYLEDTETEARKGDSFRNSRGHWYSTAEEAHTQDEQTWEYIKDAFFEASEEWIEEYVKSDDYGSEYFYLLSESSHRSEEQIAQWLDEQTQCGKRISEIVARVCVDNVIERAEAETCDEYSSCLRSDGLCLDSFQVGEHEDQVEWSRFVEWCEEHEDGIVPPMDWCIGQQYEFRGLSNGKYPAFYHYVNTGVRWDYYVNDNQTLATIILESVIGFHFASADIPDVIRLQSALSSIRGTEPGYDATPMLKGDIVRNPAGSVSLACLRYALAMLDNGHKTGNVGQYKFSVSVGGDVTVGCQIFSAEQVAQVRRMIGGVS
jgi:hypothetical protein